MNVSDSSYRILSALLETRTGQQLTMSRRWRIETALNTLMRERAIESLDQLIAILMAGGEPSLAEQVVEGLLNNETYFFRDRSPFDLLLNQALQKLQKARAHERRLRIWCAGCSTGQEVYSLAMSFAEDKPRWRGWSIDILGTDVSRSAVERAREGVYSQFEVQRGLPVVQMMRWFREEPGSQWRIASALRDSVRFQVHSLREAVPQPGNFDIILCRNVLLYFTPEMRRQTFIKLAHASAPDAFLMLGAGETVIGHTQDFTPDMECRGLYVRAPLDVPAKQSTVPRAAVA